MKNIIIGLVLFLFLLMSANAEQAYTIEYYASIHHIYPDITDSDFTISDFGGGQFISMWNFTQPIPSEQELNTAWNEILAQRQQDEINLTMVQSNQTSIINTVKSEYESYITDLDNIQNTQNPTNAQVIEAVKREAYIEEKILKLLKYVVLWWI